MILQQAHKALTMADRTSQKKHTQILTLIQAVVNGVVTKSTLAPNTAYTWTHDELVITKAPPAPWREPHSRS